MSQYSLYHNNVHFTVICNSIPNDDEVATVLMKSIVKDQLHRSWKPEERYVLSSSHGDHFIYDNGKTYRMADSG